MEIECVYENGVLRPLKPVKLKEGEKVKILVRSLDLRDFVMAKLSEEKIKELELRFEDEGIY